MGEPTTEKLLRDNQGEAMRVERRSHPVGPGDGVVRSDAIATKATSIVGVTGRPDIGRDSGDILVRELGAAIRGHDAGVVPRAGHAGLDGPGDPGVRK